MVDERTTDRTRKSRRHPDERRSRKHMSEEARDADPGTGEQVGEGVGGIGGVLAGAGIGSLAGPIGTVLGGIAGGVGGWWAGEKVGRAIEDIDEHEDHYREHWEENVIDGFRYEDARVAYGIGHLAGRNPDYRGRTFETIEPEIRENWAHDRYRYEIMRPYVRVGYYRTSGTTRAP